ncbi:MAG: hypothetical protein CVV64_11305 [Candidatus Wallbacteria bacterium HGW-Wallbacteria-1]|jgi:hypothetical protein|uniref:Uncharacterized protein n=1 Tax=Candidatus Wallbacteria bacterium HGW-Wallbacteria-1 TaxID=2013854 RepID=A0A2N1PP38_9BACT|nr:MAG: hypothetical protein CVV64_11305 [Candidatus Wallbacteria bacterium HGW-Wallbacteria-1]
MDLDFSNFSFLESRCKDDQRKVYFFGSFIVLILGVFGSFKIYDKNLIGGFIFHFLSGIFFLWMFFFLESFKTVFRLVMKFTSLIGSLFQTLFLIVAFYLIFTPMGLIISLFREDEAKKFRDPSTFSYWKTHEKSTRESYFSSFKKYTVLVMIFEFYRFLGERKKYWLLPVIIFLTVLGAIMIYAESSVLAPFIYTLF